MFGVHWLNTCIGCTDTVVSVPALILSAEGPARDMGRQYCRRPHVIPIPHMLQEALGNQKMLLSGCIDMRKSLNDGLPRVSGGKGGRSHE
jgi:hypothetical protein